MKWDVQNFTAALDEVVNRLASQCLGTQSTPMATCEESKEEHNMKERLDDEKYCLVLEQLEEATIDEDKEEVVEDLGDVKPPWEPRVEENPSKKIKIDVKEECALPPRHIP